jgi:hypothetical protein
MTKKVYIAGKVTGLPQKEVIEKFEKDERIFREMGFDPVNPIRVVNDWSMEWKPAMKLCIAALMQCDYIYLQPDFNNSRGAWKEMELARMVGIEIIKSV